MIYYGSILMVVTCFMFATGITVLLATAAIVEILMSFHGKNLVGYVVPAVIQRYNYVFKVFLTNLLYDVLFPSCSLFPENLSCLARIALVELKLRAFNDYDI